MAKTIIENDSVVYIPEMKGLDPGTVGIATNIHDGIATVTYPQNKGTMKVYAHSAKMTDLKFAHP